MSRALAAGSAAELQALVADLPGDSPWESLKKAAIRAGSRVKGSLKPRARPILLRAPPPGAELPLVVGRGAGCNLLLSDPTVSRQHIELRREGDAWIVHDLGSLNGVSVNGWRVDRAELRNGDVISLGAVELVFDDAAL
jgi:hypothetical protein